MLAELTKASGGLKQVNTVDLLVSLTQLWEKDPRVPEYLNGIRDGQKKAKRAGLPFLDDLLSTIASSSLLKTNSSRKDRPKWDRKIPEDQTLQAWEYYFLPLHKDPEQELRLATGCGDAFGSAHSADLIHDITPSATAGAAGSQRAAGAPASFMEQLDGHLGALSAAATGSTVVMEALDMVTNTQYNKIMATVAGLKMLSIAASATTGGGNRDSDTVRLTPNERTKSNLCINKLMLEIKVNWAPGGFCSTHGHIVGPGHSKFFSTTIPGRARWAAKITVPRALTLPALDETRTNIGINFCCDGGPPLTIV